MVFPLLASSIAPDKWGCDLERAMNAAADEEEAEGPTSESCFFGLGTSAKDRLR